MASPRHSSSREHSRYSPPPLDLPRVSWREDHMYRMGMMAFVARDSKLDTDKCIKMALVHDVAEAIVGDITPYCGVSKEEKQRRENEAMEEIRDMIGGDSEAAREMVDLWAEYSEAKTEEAKFVKDLDKLEMILQADEYEEEQDKDLEEFFSNTEDVFTTNIGKELAEKIRAERRSRLDGQTHEAKN